MTKTELAWAAGIIDGEGCFHLKHHHPGTPYYSLVLKVTMGHRETIRRLHKMFGVGTIQVVDQWQYNPAWSWVCTTRQVEKVLDQVMPLLFTKQKEALIAREFLALKTNPGVKVTPREAAKRQRLFEKMRDAKPSARFRADAKNRVHPKKVQRKKSSSH